ncbi:Maternal effect embryo arrest protein [Quillaja saponaria]|uniref:Maternal effect embryo arrest protein n=1 Tax=Quillaja saponaria TaxID=32244 RepID=A0AAD7LPA7_QUISA|nr:Maternal effect embryo arrest protein [Quillaja saponaria]
MEESEQYPKEYYNEDSVRRIPSASSSSSTTSVHVTALDGLVNVNSLFTIAVFVGLSLTTQGQHSLENTACDAGIDVARKLLVFEVVSFSFFLFSSLVAQGLKLAINLLNSKDVDEAFRAHINLKVLRFGMMGSAIGSVMGCLFLMLSMVNVIEIRLGMLSCGSKSAIHAVTALVVLVGTLHGNFHLCQNQMVLRQHFLCQIAVSN